MDARRGEVKPPGTTAAEGKTNTLYSDETSFNTIDLPHAAAVSETDEAHDTYLRCELCGGYRIAPLAAKDMCSCHREKSEKRSESVSDALVIVIIARKSS